MTRYTLLCLAALAVTACENAVTPTQPRPSFAAGGSSGTTLKVDTVITASTFGVNPCNGEEFTAVGKEHLVETVTLSGSTQTNDTHINLDDLQGVGAVTGVSYHANIAAHETSTQQNTFPFPFTQTIHENAQFVSQGSTQNFTLKLLQTFTFDGSTSTVTTKVDDQSCNG